jgi:hypothetical protein
MRCSQWESSHPSGSDIETAVISLERRSSEVLSGADLTKVSDTLVFPPPLPFVLLSGASIAFWACEWLPTKPPSSERARDGDEPFCLCLSWP